MNNVEDPADFDTSVGEEAPSYDGEPASSAVAPPVVDPRVIAPARTGREIATQLDAIRWLKDNVMLEGVHYGPAFPGSDKRTLLKPGAELLFSLFGLHPKFSIAHEVRDYGRDGEALFDYEVKCRVFINGTTIQVGEGSGSCSTWESRYRYRDAKRRCPACEKETIIKGKAEYGGGWLCFRKLGGCGAKFDDGDPIIEDQPSGRVLNEDVLDLKNTVLKMAEKRAMIQAILVTTGSSFLFTQDEELLDSVAPPPEEPPARPAAMVIDHPPAAPPSVPKEDRRLRPPARPEDQPWQDYIRNWGQPEWASYWVKMRDRQLDDDEVHAALGNPQDARGEVSVRAFSGTRGQHNSRIEAAARDKQRAAPKTGRVALDGADGQFIASRVQVRAITGGWPQVTIWALDAAGREDALIAFNGQIEPARLRAWLPATPKKLPVDGESLLYRHDPASGVQLLVTWERVEGALTIQDVSLTDAA